MKKSKKIMVMALAIVIAVSSVFAIANAATNKSRFTENKYTYGDKLVSSVTSFAYRILNIRYFNEPEMKFPVAVGIKQEISENEAVLTAVVSPEKCRAMEAIWMVYNDGSFEPIKDIIMNNDGYSLTIKNNMPHEKKLEVYCYVGDGLFAVTEVVLSGSPGLTPQ